MPAKDQAAYRRKRRAEGKDQKRYPQKPANLLAATRRYAAAHPERVRAQKRKQRQHKKPSAEYERKFREQAGLCAICCKPEPINGRRLADDHDHETGKRRGLLCSLCNCGIGLLQDDPSILLKAVVYLNLHGKVGAL